MDQQATSTDLPKSLVILDGRGNLCFQRSLRYSLISLFKLVLRCCSSDRNPQVESLVPPPDGHNTTGEINPAIHGLNGPVEISVQDTTPLDSRIFNTTMQLAEFPFNEDANSGDPIGIGAFCWARLHSTRSNICKVGVSSRSAVERGAVPRSHTLHQRYPGRT